MFQLRYLRARQKLDNLLAMRIIMFDLLKRTLIISLGIGLAAATLAVLISRIF